MSASIENPFPGIRSFETGQSHLFHGRKEQAEELVRLLGKNRFLSVVGSSGSGKSSLIKAGLLPRLYRGYLSGATSRWRIALLQPGAHPISALADAVRSSHALCLEASCEAVALRLQSSSLGLVEVVRTAQLPARESLLVVVDQFEEVFRFRRKSQAVDDGREAAHFVDLLLATRHIDIPIYIVLTMRSDFLGDCAQFPDLPEALNQAQYLVPRMSREQREQAIVLPLETVGAEITPALTQRLLNDAGDDPEQLPALQHALMQLWESHKENGMRGPLDAHLYTPELQVGHSLESHAHALFCSLCDEDQRYAALLFRCLTTVEDGRTVRRPAKLKHIYAVVGAASGRDQERVRAVIRLYAATGNSLLLSSTGDAISDETVIDITHETLIRQWSLLNDWVKLEAESAEWLSHLIRSAELHSEGKAGFIGNPDADFVWERATGDGWNAAWASQYRDGFSQAMAFLTTSRELIAQESRKEEDRRQNELQTAQALIEAERKNVRAERRARLRLSGAALALAMTVGGLIWLTVELQREKMNALHLSQLSKAAEERALVAENRAKADAAESQAAHAAGPERERLRKEAEQFNIRAEELARNASRTGPLPDTSDTALRQIRDLQTQLARADAENRKLRNQLSAQNTYTGGLQSSAQARTVSPAVVNLQFLPAEEATKQFGSKIGAECQVVQIRITNPNPESRRISKPTITVLGQVRKFRVVHDRREIKKDVLWMPSDILPGSRAIEMYYFVAQRVLAGGGRVSIKVPTGDL